MTEFVSLFEYLGRAAGPDLGKSVAIVAANRKIPFMKRAVETRGYVGEVMTYPKEFLIEYFNTPKTGYKELISLKNNTAL